jgi:hypothetical protein
VHLDLESDESGKSANFVRGGSYSGMAHYGVTVLEIVPEPATLLLVGLGGLVLRMRN